MAGSLNDLETIRAIIARLEASDTPQRYHEVYKLRNAAAADVQPPSDRSSRNSLNCSTPVPARSSAAYQQLQRNVVMVAEPVSNTLLDQRHAGVLRAR